MSDTIQGLDLFASFFKDYTDNYIIVGGTACFMNMNNVGLDFRVTKDIDMIITVEEMSKEFGLAFWKFIKEGGYSIYKSEGTAKFFRFMNPTNHAFPAMIELFSRKNASKELRIENSNDKSIFTKIVLDDELSSLSAILLDDAYYNFLKTGKTIINGLSVLQPIYLIAFKAKAFNDLYTKKEKGEFVSSTDIKKHKYDVFRLSQLLTGNEIVALNGMVQKDMMEFFHLIESEVIPMEQLKINSTQKISTELIKKIFKIQ